MADDATVFGVDQTPSQQTTSQADPLLDVLVGEGRKYKTVGDLVKGHMAANDFIETLKAEKHQVEEELKKAKSIDDVLARLDAKPGSTTETPGSSAADIAKIVDARLSGREIAKVRDENIKKADAGLKSLYGDKAQEVFNREATTPEQVQALTQLAAVDPAKFLALFTKAAPANTSQTTSSGSSNTTAMTQNPASGRTADPETKEYYSALRKSNPQKYWSSQVQQEMDRVSQKNPAKFFGA